LRTLREVTMSTRGEILQHVLHYQLMRPKDVSSLGVLKT
jgi:hypothetical protein